MVFSWWQRWSEREFLPCWQHFQKGSKTAKQCNRIHNMNSNNRTRIIWRNDWASKLKCSGSTRAEEPWRALRALLASRALQVKALQAAKLWECGGGESAKTAGWLSSDWEVRPSRSCSGPLQTLTRPHCHTGPAGLFCFLQLHLYI